MTVERKRELVIVDNQSIEENESNIVALKDDPMDELIKACDIYNTIIGGIGAIIFARDMTSNQDTRHKLGIALTTVITDAEDKLAGAVSGVEGDVDEDLIIGHRRFIPSSEALQVMQFVLGAGIPEALTEKNFPSLGALPNPAIDFLRNQGKLNRGSAEELQKRAVLPSAGLKKN